MVAIQHENFEMDNEKNREKADVINMTKGDWEHLSDEGILFYKGIFIEQYFFHDGYAIEARNEKSKSAILRLWNKYGYFYEDKQEFMSEVMTAVCSIVIAFKESQETYDYSQLIVEGTREHNAMHSYIVKPSVKNISALETEIMKYASFNSNIKYSNGKAKMLEMLSLDKEMVGEEGAYTLHGAVAIESNAFYSREGYVPTEEDSSKYEYKSQYFAPHFKVWFLKWVESQKVLRKMNQPAQLTNAQIEYWDVMRNCFVGELISDKNGYEGTYTEAKRTLETEGYKTYNESQIYEYNRGIRKRALEAYSKEFPSGELTFLQMQHEEDREILKEVIEIIEDENTSNNSLNYKLTRWIHKNFNQRVVQSILEQMDSSDYFNVTSSKMARTKLESQTLYKFVDLVEKKLDEIATSTHEKVKFYKRNDEFIEGSKAKALEAKKLRDEKYKAFVGDTVKKPSYIVQKVTPFGAIVELDLFDDEIYDMDF
ncbi:hypothetical protein QT711_03205 [Sporosarcina saromensis]|uniref:Uncharacterized protein n=1 Tax=Sporosarcina saromensis TaxID=359365 RepID=A0ABU4G787_9BACL|nr:hypothetical protein [Sporosarcina saromensis]MDW0112178.1 hypothetical protein [Sporosarcina saromensis]